MKIGIIGGGASGILSALLLKKAHPKWEVTIYEANDRIAQKILKTGNGRCNLGHSGITAKDYPFDLTKQLTIFNEDVFINTFKELGIFVFKDEEGRYYPESESSKQVVSILLNQLERYHVEIKTNKAIASIEDKNNYYIIDHNRYDAVIIATGGKSQSEYNGSDIFKELKIKTIPYQPALVGLKTVENIKALSGIRRKVNVKAVNFEEAGEVQFKDEGVSGIVVMNYSRVVQKGDVFTLDLAPHYSKADLKDLLKEHNKEEIVNGLFPKSLATYLLKEKDLILAIKEFKLTVKDTYSFKEAQISLGGVDLKEINEYFEAKAYPHLYILGEALNNDGACGGYNLYFAWLSSYIACLDIDKKMR